jgi:hypothetical protein
MKEQAKKKRKISFIYFSFSLFAGHILTTIATDGYSGRLFILMQNGVNES